MPDAFELFGTLKLETGSFESSLVRSEARIKSTEKALERLEKQGKSAGQTSAVAARHQEKLNETLATARTRLANATDAFNKGQISGGRLSTVIAQTDNKLTALNSRVKDASARFQDMAGRMSPAIAALSRFNTHIAIAGTAVAGFVLKSGLDMDKIRNKFIALEGSTEKANARIKQLLQLSRTSPGVMFGDASEAFGFLTSLGKVGESSITKMIQALGRLKLGFEATMGSSTDFLINMQQLFDQGFESQDIKQAIGRVPIFQELLKSAFGTNDPEKLRQLKESGKLTMDSFMSGLSEAVANNKNLANVRESFSTQFARIWEEMNISAAPLGEKFLAAIKPELDRALAGLRSGSFSEVGGAIGSALGKAIGAAMRAAIESEMAGGTSISGSDLGKGILSGFNADSATTIIKTFFNKIAYEIQVGLVDLAALAVNSNILGMGFKLTDKLIESMGFTVDETNSGMKKINSHFKEIREGVKQQYDENSVQLLQASKNASDKIANDTALPDAIREQAKKQSDALATQITELNRKIEESVKLIGVEQVKRGVHSVLDDVPAEVGPAATAGGQSIGTNIASGMASGIASGRSTVISAAIGLANAAWQSAKDALGIQSPSKVFMALGKDTAQGFIDGIAAMKASVQSAMAGILDVSGLKIKFGKGDKAGVEMLTQLTNELAKVNVETKLQEVLIDLTASKYAKLNKEIRDRIILAAKEFDAMAKAELVAAGIEKLDKAWADMFQTLTPAEKALAEVNELFKDKEVLAGLATYDAKIQNLIKGLMRLGALQGAFENTLGSGRPESTGDTGGIKGLSDSEEQQTADYWKKWWADLHEEAPPPHKPWADFWTMMQTSLQTFRDSLPSIKQTLGENLINSIQGIGDVFANAVMQWDGTAKGFFKSLAQGFRQMVSQIVAELVRLMVIKAIMQLIGAVAGGVGGGGSGGGGGGGGFDIGDGGGWASGGFTGIGGRNTPAGIVHKGEYVMDAKTVRKLGIGFFDGLKNLTSSPAMAFAGGGFVGGSSSMITNSTSNVSSPTINVYMPQGSSGSNVTKDQVERAVLIALHKNQNRNK